MHTMNITSAVEVRTQAVSPTLIVAAVSSSPSTSIHDKFVIFPSTGVHNNVCPFVKMKEDRREAQRREDDQVMVVGEESERYERR